MRQSSLAILWTTYVETSPLIPSFVSQAISSLMSRRPQTLALVAVAGVLLWASLMVFVKTGLPLSGWASANEPSVLVILVENLGFGAFSCGENSTLGGSDTHGAGFQTFCDEAVRFTHAYAPSTLSQATVSSILTAKYPYRTGVHHNGDETLSAHETTLPERALTEGYRTSFFSGGPPIWRRSGINQGFDVFDDNVALSLKRIYRSAPEIAKLFLGWQETESPRDHFLSFLFFPDLQFIDAATTNELGEVRESSFESQMEAVDEALSRIIKEMKRRKIWDSTEVFLVGLQGDAAEERDQSVSQPYGPHTDLQVDQHADEIPSMNLYSESVRTTLMIKPARKTRGGASVFNWKIDASVSLVDVGATLLDLIGGGSSTDPESAAPLYSLRSALAGPQPDWPSDRLILSESAWAKWRGLGNTRMAARQGPYLFIDDESPRLFNTLTDNFETTPLSFKDPVNSQLRDRLATTLRGIGYPPAKIPGGALPEVLLLARDLWREREPSADTLAHLRTAAQRFPNEPRLRAWRATWAIRQGDWTELKAVASQLPLQPLWSFVAEKNMGERAVLPDDPCLDFLKSPQPLLNPALPKNCRFDGLADLLAWANESMPEAQRLKAMDQFMRSYIAKALATKVAEQNEVVGLRWDTVPLADAPDLFDLILSLPEMKKYKAAVKTRLITEGR